MAKVKRKRISRGRISVPSPSNPKAKPLKISLDVAKYLGFEPEFTADEITDENRMLESIHAFNWYNYSFGAKDAHKFVIDYLKAAKRTDDAKTFKKSSELLISTAIGWLARMTFMGWTLNSKETEYLEGAISKGIASVGETKKVITDKDQKTTKLNIQDRMRIKTAGTEGELAGMVDDYIAAGCKAKHAFSPITVLKTANILPGHVNEEIAAWEIVRNEFNSAYNRKDADLTEAYSHLSKLHLRNITKFIDLIIADHHSYVAFKKATKTPRKRKSKTPAELVFKLKYARDFLELKLKSISPTKIIGARELFVYSTKKRKLQHYVADEHAGNALTVKNNTIVGFDTTKSTQKTIRKPKDQIPALMKAGRPNTRKIFANIKAVEIKLSGRFADDLVILKVF